MNSALDTKISLNEVQKKAVEHAGGPLLLLASPGSGKTTTIIMRIGYLIKKLDASPKRILAISFSQASAKDLRYRFEQLFPELQPPNFSTIHSLAFYIARIYLEKQKINYLMIDGYGNEPTNDESLQRGEKHEQTAWKQSANGIVDGQSVRKVKLLQSLYEQINGVLPKEEQLEELQTYISVVKNKRLDADKWSTIPCHAPNAAKIMEAYEQMKLKNSTAQRWIDFDDMLTIAMEALENDKMLRHRMQQKYDYILTDESQDTSYIQHCIIDLIANKHQQLFVVADDDQAIYSWRGAEPKYLLNFRDRYPNAELLFLQQNYRSTKKIVEAANQLIKLNKARYPKIMFTDNELGAPFVFQSFDHMYAEAAYIAEEIQKQPELKETAVLYRNHASSLLLMNELDKRSIPFYMKDADDRFFSHWIIEDILNFMRLSYSDKHFNIFEALAMKMQLYLPLQTIQALKANYEQQPIFQWLEQELQLKAYQLDQLKRLQQTIPTLKTLRPDAAIIEIRETLGYNKVIASMSDKLGFKKEYLFSILDSLQTIAADVERLDQFASRLRELAEVQKQAKQNRHRFAVTLSTLHSAKGLEFNTVYMMDLVEGVIPSQADTEQADLLEEALRLFYVGMTRAKKHLELLTVANMYGKKVAPSRFYKYVYKAIHESSMSNTKSESRLQHPIKDANLLKAGQQVYHVRFLDGKIINNDGNKVHIYFDHFGEKAFLLSLLIDGEMIQLKNIRQE